MKAYRLAAAGLALGLLTGCASLLERSYTTSEPHSSKFWESEAAATLRAENRQDMVNDLLILIGQHTETASLRLYNFPDEQTALEELEKAAQEVQQETPLGAYAVEYITYISQPQRSCFEADLQIGYRRTAEQMQTIVSASSVSALGDLLEAALDGGRTELVVRMGYWQADSREKVAQEVQQVRQERGTREEAVWIVHYYPETDPVGIIEFLLKPTEEEIQAEIEARENAEKNAKALALYAMVEDASIAYCGELGYKVPALKSANTMKFWREFPVSGKNTSVFSLYSDYDYPAVLTSFMTWSASGEIRDSIAGIFKTYAENTELMYIDDLLQEIQDAANAS